MKMCHMNPRVACDSDASGQCQCVPPAWPGTPEAWRAMAYDQRKAFFRADSTRLADSIVAMLDETPSGNVNR